MSDGSGAAENGAPKELQRVRRQRRRAEWVVAFLLGGIAATGLLAVFGPLQPGGGSALAQVPGGFGARGVYAFAGQITRNSYGLWMLDVDAGTLWCYELVEEKGQGARLRLQAARSWIHDRYLKEFNISGLTPAEVAEMVDEQDRSLLVGEPEDKGERRTPEPADTAPEPGDDIRPDNP